MRIAVGMSGGVDSSVACHLLKQEGHEVIGITMRIWDSEASVALKKSACFGPDEETEIEEARAFASGLGIPYHVIDLAKEYKSSIIGYFKREYGRGRTPNPCINCNRLMKFGLLLEKAETAGIRFDKFATGHYARVAYDGKSGRYLLKKGIDARKDQSYFLGLLSQEQLSRVVFPLGTYTKEKVKEIAKTFGFPAYDKKESQDFYSGDYGELIDEKPNPGRIIGKDGRLLGMHKGLSRYTIGQRRGIGVASNIPLYVTGMDCDTNTVTVGTEDELLGRRLLVRDVNWIGIQAPECGLSAQVKIRYMHHAQQAKVSPADEDAVIVEFESPQRAITPGQYAVFYDNDTVLGAGVIDKVLQ